LGFGICGLVFQKNCEFASLIANHTNPPAKLILSDTPLPGEKYLPGDRVVAKGVE
jgi:hypothetical protein